MPYSMLVAREAKLVLTVRRQGRLVIPASVRRRLRISPGDQMTVTIDKGRLVLEPRAAAAARARGMFKQLARGASVVDELVAQRREEARRENAD